MESENKAATFEEYKRKQTLKEFKQLIFYLIKTFIWTICLELAFITANFIWNTKLTLFFSIVGILPFIVTLVVFVLVLVGKKQRLG